MAQESPSSQGFKSPLSPKSPSFKTVYDDVCVFIKRFELCLSGHTQAGGVGVAEGFCLVWPEPNTGVVKGRKVDGDMQMLVVAGLLLDLFASSTVELVDKDIMFGVTKTTKVKIQREAATGDAPCDLLIGTLQKRQQPWSLGNWMGQLWGHPEFTNAVFDSLVAKGMLKKVESRTLGVVTSIDFPTADAAPFEELRGAIRGAILGDGAGLDAKQTAVLGLCRLADKCHGNNVFLSRFLSADELKQESVWDRVAHLMGDPVCLDPNAAPDRF